MPVTRKEIRSYWNEQARLQRLDDKGFQVINESRDTFIGPKGQGGTLKDPRLREIEIRTLVKYLPCEGNLLDIGCGNGYTTIELLRRIPGLTAVGIDYAEKMIGNASRQLEELDDMGSRAQFLAGDTTELTSLLPKKAFDIVITVRCLINLESWESQQQALDQIARVLRPGGIFLMMEGSCQSTQRLNKAREAIDLPPFKGIWHNLYLDEDKLLPYLSQHFILEESVYYCSTYMFLTRCVLHALRPPEERWDYEHPMFDLAMKLPNEGQYGFYKLFRLRKRENNTF